MFRSPILDINLIFQSRRKRARTPTPGHYLGLKNARADGECFLYHTSLYGIFCVIVEVLNYWLLSLKVIVVIAETVVGIETVRTMGTEDLQGIHHLEVDEIILLGAHLMGEGQEGSVLGHILLMKGAILVVPDRT